MITIYILPLIIKVIRCSINKYSILSIFLSILSVSLSTAIKKVIEITAVVLVDCPSKTNTLTNSELRTYEFSIPVQEEKTILPVL